MSRARGIVRTAALAGLVLAGCAAPMAQYTHPQSQARMTCERRSVDYVWIWGGHWAVDGVLAGLSAGAYAWDTAQASSEYATCKTAAEAAGYLREPAR